MSEIAVRHLGSGKVHRADVNPDDLLPAEVWGAPCTLVALSGVAALCGAVLRGTVIEIPEGEKLDSWRARRGGICRTCELLSGVPNA